MTASLLLLDQLPIVGEELQVLQVVLLGMYVTCHVYYSGTKEFLSMTCCPHTSINIFHLNILVEVEDES